MPSNGYIVWEGSSEVDGNPIVLLLTGTLTPSSNPKTGWMMQTWIMRSDVHPLESIHNNNDVSVCGDCPLKGSSGHKRSCYVNLATLGNIYRVYKRGGYPQLIDLKSIRRRSIRLGAYGDPAAIPYGVWEPLLLAIDPTLAKPGKRDPLGSVVRTGYTHLWKIADPRFQKVTMASVESPALREAAKEKGWRTYRVKRPDELVLPGEIICPASKETEIATTCVQCGLCGGTSVKGPDIVINIHGSRTKYF